MENISFTHEDIVSDLNFLLNDKAQWVKKRYKIQFSPKQFTLCLRF